MFLRQRPSDSETIRIIASLLPEIACDPDCHICCCSGDLAMTWWDNGETEIIHSYKDYDESGSCISLTEGRCINYEDRQLICRVFWKSEDHVDVCLGGKRAPWLLSREDMRRIFWCINSGTKQDAMALKATLLPTKSKPQN